MNSRMKPVFWVLNMTVVVLLFFFLTAGIPLIQLGILQNFGEGKKQYLKISRLAVMALGVLLPFLRWKLPAFFERLWAVCGLKRLQNLPQGKMVFIFWAVYSAAMIAACGFRHLALETRAFDLGIFAQALWNTTQGHFLESSLKGGICLLGDHFSPLLVLLAPLYRLWPAPESLLVVQPLISALCFFPLAQLALKISGNRKTVLVFCLIYFFYMPTRAALHEDFHPEVLVEPLMLWAFLWLAEGRKALFCLALALILAAKENMAGVTFMLGFYAFFFKKERGVGAFWMIFSPLYLWLCVHVFIPSLSGQPYLYSGFYRELAQGGVPALWGILKDSDRWEYLVKVFGPVLFLPLFDFPSLLLTLPVLFQNLLSENATVRSMNYHYMTGLTPFVLLATLLGLEKIQRLEWLRKRATFLLMGLLFSALLQSGAPEYFYGWQSASRVSARTRMIRAEMGKIPGDAVLVTHNSLIPQAINRRQVYQFDYNDTTSKTDMALRERADYVVFDAHFWEAGTAAPEIEKKKLLTKGYGIQFENDGFVLFKKM